MGATTRDVEDRPPNRPDELSAAWLERVLAIPDDELEGFDSAPLGEGVGLMGIVHRVRLQWRRGNGPRSVIAKFPTDVESNLAVAEHFGIYRREILFYRDVAPLTAIAVPRLLHAELDGPTRFVMLLEDLAEHRPGDQVAGCSEEEAAACIDEMVELHAPFWDRVDDPRFEFAFLHAPSLHSTGMADATVNGWDPMVATFGAAVPPFMAEVRDRFLAAVPALQRWFATPPITFVHADYRLDNVLFGTAPEHAPVVTLDWQGVLRSKGAQDVAFLLSQSMDPGVRRACEADLVARWQRGLAEAGVTGYSPEQAWSDYRTAVLALWIYVVVIAGALDPTNERGRAFMTTMIERAAAAIHDLDALSLLPDFEG